MSEHDEPKTALTRLLGDHRYLGRTYGGFTGCRGCDWTHPVAQSEAGKVAHAAHLADVLLAEGYTTSPAPEATETVEQYGVCVFWEDPLAAGADPKKEPWWAVLDTQEKADRFAQSYQATLGQMAERMPWLAQAENFDPAEVWTAQNVAEVRRATRWAVERYGPWVPVDRAVDEHEEGGQ